MKIAVSGTNGFVGGHLCSFLQTEGEKCQQIARCGESSGESSGENRGEKWEEHSLAQLTQCDAVVHLAARAHVLRESAEDPLREFRKANVEMTVNLAKAAVQAGIKRFVFVSSIGVLGSRGSFSVASPCAPLENYAVAKLEAEIALQELCSQTNMELVIVRPPLVYGPGVQGNFARLIKLVKRFPLLPLGRVNAQRSYVGVTNLCSLLHFCCHSSSAPGQTFLAGDGQDRDTADLLREIACYSNRQLWLLPVPRFLMLAAGKVLGKSREIERLFDSLTVNIDHTCTTLGWTPPQTFAQELKRTLEFAETV